MVRTDRNYNPNLDLKAQELLHDEMESLILILNLIPAHLRGVMSFVLFDDDGEIHTLHCARILSEDNRSDAIRGMFDVCAKLLEMELQEP